ncbi:unnamed protein product [Schistosoma curassoni]|uniref:BZIP domain-containing protein n=1 Tax=Schistosoma curassoni TaxID=6186 RepID=A0A183KY32_9TREM|nr:unnamed protein product [Schistosoma curassoni]
MCSVHHEEFILSGTLRQELDYDAYQIQYVSTLRNSLKAAVAAAAAATALSNNNNIKNGNNNNSNASVTILPPPTSLRFDNHSSNNNTIIDTQNILSSSFAGLIPRCQTDPLINNQQIHLSLSSIIQNPSSQQSNYPSTTFHQIVVSSSSITKNTSSMSNDAKFIRSTIASCNDVHDTHILTDSYVTLSSYKPSTNIQSLSNSHLQLTCSSDISCQSVINNTTCRLVSKITKADTNLSYLLSRSNTLDQISIKNNLTCSLECDITNTLSTSFPSLSSSGCMLLSSTISPSVSSHQDFGDMQLDRTIGASNKPISDLIISVCNVNTCSTMDSLNTNNNDKNNSIMLPPKPSATAYIASFDNKRLIIGNNRSTNNSLLLNCTSSTVSDAFLSNQDTKPNILHPAAASALNSSNHNTGVIVVSANSGCGNNNNDSNAEIINKTGIGLTVSTPVIIVGVGSDSGLGIPIRSSSSSSRGNILAANNTFPSSELIDSSRNLLFNIQQQPVSSSSVAFTTSSPTKLSLTIGSLDVVKNLIKNQTDFRMNNSLVDNITISIDSIGNNNTNSNSDNNNGTTTDSSLIFQSSMPLQQSSHKLISSSIPVNTTHDDCDNKVGDAVSLPYSFSLSSSLSSDFALIHHNTAITTTHNIVLGNTSNYFVVQSSSSPTSVTTTLSSSMPVSYTSNLIHCLDKEHSSVFSTYQTNSNNNECSEISDSHIEKNNDNSIMTTGGTAANTTTICNMTSDNNAVVMTTPLTELYYPNIMNEDNINCNNNDIVCTVQSTTLNIQTSSNSTISFCSLPCSMPSISSSTSTTTITML